MPTQSVGAVALDIIMGKNTVTGVVKNAMSECQKVISDSSASMANKVGAVGNACTSVGKALTPMSAAALGAGVAIGKMATNFEDAMAKVNTIADTSEVPLAELQKQIIELSNKSGISSSEIADNVYNAISAGQKTGDAVNFVANSTKLAKAGFADAGASLDILTTILNSYGMEAKEVTRVSDVLIATQNKGKTTVGELSSYMGKVIPTANAYGVNLENVAANYAIMTAKGIATAESTTYMNSMFNELGKSSTGVAKKLQEISGKSFKELMNEGKSVGDVLMILKDNCDATGTQFTDLWGSAEAGKAALVLTQEGAKGFNDMLGNMQNSAGMTDEAFGKMETTSYTIGKAMNTLKNTGIELGNTLMQTLGPMIEKFSQKVAAFSKWFSSLDEGTKKIIVKIGMFVAALAPVLIVGGKIISGISSLMGAMGALGKGIGFLGSLAVKIAPFISGTLIPAIGSLFAFLAANPIVLIIGAIIAAGALLITHWEDVKKVAQAVWEFIGNIISVVWDGIKNVVSAAVDFVKNVISAGFELIKNIVATFVNLWKDIISAGWNLIKNVVTSVVSGIKNTILNIFTAVKNGVSSIIGGVKDVIVNGLTGAFNFIKGIPAQAVQWGRDMIGGLVKGIKGAIGWVGDAAKGVASKITSFLHFSVPDEGPLTEYESWMPDFMGGMAKGIKDSQYLVTDAIRGVSADMAINPMIAPPQLKNASTGKYGGQTTYTDGMEGNSETKDLLKTVIELLKQDRQYTIPVYLGADLLDEQTVKADRMRALRSGGKA